MRLSTTDDYILRNLKLLGVRCDFVEVMRVNLITYKRYMTGDGGRVACIHVMRVLNNSCKLARL